MCKGPKTYDIADTVPPTPSQLEMGKTAEMEQVAVHDAKQIPITFSNVSYKVKKDTILNSVTGSFAPGRMTALMGPSGSGKTTLMDILANRKYSGNVSGDVRFGGSKVSKSVLRTLCGYVEQFDTLIGELTVKQMLMYTAELKLPTTATRQEKEARVSEVLLKLGLDDCADTVIGNQLKRGISGGQAKRVNIALALITRPQVLFLDEPTSGLDSFMANEVASFLKALAGEGRTVVCTIHTPTSFTFDLFDDLMILKKGENGGELIYSGAIAQARPHFEQLGHTFPDAGFSLAEWLIDLTCSSSSSDKAATNTDFAALYSGSILCSQMDGLRVEREKGPGGMPLVHSKPPHSAGAWKALWTLLTYRMATHYRSGEFLGPRIGDKVIFGLLILSLYWGIGSEETAQGIQSTASLLYFVAALCGYGAAAFVPSLTLDRPLFYRELADGCYSPVVYYAAKFIEEGVLATFTSVLFGVIVFWGCDLQGSFLLFVATYYLTTMTGICLAYAVAAAVPTMEAANALLPTYVTTCMYFGGLFLLFDKIPLGWRWFSWTSFLRYSWGAMMVNQYAESEVGKVKCYWDEDTNEGMNVLEFYGMHGTIMGSAPACVGMLALLTLIFAMLGAAALTGIRHGQM